MSDRGTTIFEQQVNGKYLKEQVLQKDSEPHLVYVTHPEYDVSRVYLEPEIEKAINAVEADIDQRITWVTINALCPDVAEFCQVNQILTIPTMLFFRAGNLRHTMVGFLPEEVMEHVIRDTVESTATEKLAKMIESEKQKRSQEASSAD